MLSTVVSIDPSSGSKKLGQPVPLSNLRPVMKSGWPQPAQENVPARFSLRSAHEPGPLGAMPAQHGVLLRRELCAPLGIGLLDGKALVRHRFIISILGQADLKVRLYVLAPASTLAPIERFRYRSVGRCVRRGGGGAGPSARTARAAAPALRHLEASGTSWVPDSTPMAAHHAKPGPGA